MKCTGRGQKMSAPPMARRVAWHRAPLIPRLGFGRIVVSQTEVPSLFVNLVEK
jgi:hypothetical protein